MDHGKMNCSHAYPMIDEYVDGRLGRGDRHALETHAASCDNCADALRAQLAIAETAAALPVDEPPVGFADRVVARLVDAGLVRAPAPARRWYHVRSRYRVALVTAAFLVVAIALFPALVEPLAALAGKGVVVATDGLLALEEQLSVAQAFRNAAVTLLHNLRTLKTVLFAAFSLIAPLGEVLMIPALVALLAMMAGVFGFLRGTHRRGNASFTF